MQRAQCKEPEEASPVKMGEFGAPALGSFDLLGKAYTEHEGKKGVGFHHSDRNHEEICA